MSDPHPHTASSVGNPDADALAIGHADAVAVGRADALTVGRAHAHAHAGGEGAHAHHAAAADDEPETPFWLPALGFAFFIAGGLAWALTPSAQA
ncbi:MAG TPA: hypothetical protein VH044_15110, partial [Polyangiaceae bacterium]|nr:hypothetical protein [Polyangiaceae bacterium]